MSDKSGDLLRLLQGLGDAAHDDCEVAYDAIEEIIRLRAKVEALRADAERYAYLRNASTGKLVNAVASSAFPCWLNGAELDAAIDAARAALKETK
jgi:hypothetical protein